MDDLVSEPDFAKLQTADGVVTLSAKRGLSVGARSVPIAAIDAIEVRAVQDGPYDVAVAVGEAGQDPVALLETHAFGEARTCAVAFARAADRPIRDFTLGRPIDRSWRDWHEPLLARLREAPVAAPALASPGDDLAAARHGDVLTVRMRAGTVGRTLLRFWRDRGKLKSESGVLGWILLPIGLVFLVALVPILAVLAVVLSVAIAAGKIALDVSPEGARQRGFVSAWIPAAEVRDVDIRWDVDAHGNALPRELVIRSDGAKIAFHGSDLAELEWLRASVLAALSPSGR